MNESKPVREANDATPLFLREPIPEERERIDRELTEMLRTNRQPIQVMPLPSPPATVRVTPHTESLMRPLEPGGELCVRNESGRDVLVSVGLDRLAKYLEEHYGYEARIAELERERDELRETNRRLNRRCQTADHALAEKLMKAKLDHPNLGRALSRWAYEREREKVAELERELSEARQAIRDAIRRPMGVVPVSAERFVRESEASE